MEQKDINVLELHKVLDMLAAFCSCEDACKMARELTPSSDEKEVQRE